MLCPEGVLNRPRFTGGYLPLAFEAYDNASNPCGDCVRSSGAGTPVVLGIDGRCPGICGAVLQLEASALDAGLHDTDELRKDL